MFISKTIEKGCGKISIGLRPMKCVREPTTRSNKDDVDVDDGDLTLDPQFHNGTANISYFRLLLKKIKKMELLLLQLVKSKSISYVPPNFSLISPPQI